MESKPVSGPRVRITRVLLLRWPPGGTAGPTAGMVHDGQLVEHGRAELVALDWRQRPLGSRLGEDVLDLLGGMGFGDDLLEAVIADTAPDLWVDKLQAVSGVANQPSTLPGRAKKRHDFFHQVGCRVSDHGLEQIVAEPHTAKQIEDIFAKARAKRALAPVERDQFRSAMLYELAIMDHARGWTQQFHLGAMRNNSTRVMRTLGPDTGFDSIGDYPQAAGLARLLDRLDSTNQLCKTIIYNLNPADNEVIATMLGNFQDGSCPGKIQFGAAWWFMDQKDGMERQMNALSALGLLSRFVGMLTDSRSFLSYSRHEYFRRLLCNLLGNDVENGLIPGDMDLLGNMVRDICFATRASTLASSPRPRSGAGNSMAAGAVVAREDECKTVSQPLDGKEVSA